MRVGILGYGNVGKGVELACHKDKNVELVGIFTKRDKEKIKTQKNSKVYSVDELDSFKNEIDVLIICGGSATELPILTKKYAKDFNVVDSFDTHKEIINHFYNVDSVARENKHTALISCGWDPGLFSMIRLLGKSIFLDSEIYTFWGKGVSQGHSDAVRRIDGVIDARQYTIPKDEAIELVKSGKGKNLTVRDKHLRVCYVVIDEKADKNKIESEIKNMPNYFVEYDTEVYFITKEEMEKNHKELAHGGKVIVNGKTGVSLEHNHLMEYNLTLDSNPEFTASCLVAFSKAIYKMNKRNDYGCKTVFDINLFDISDMTKDELLKNFL